MSQLSPWSLIRWAIVVLLLAGFAVQAQEPTQLAAPTALARLVKKVAPDYPAAAKQLNVQGSQEVSITVNTSGDVEDAKVVKGNAMFTQASLAAVKQWKFTPLLKDGTPVKFSAVITFTYTK